MAGGTEILPNGTDPLSIRTKRLTPVGGRSTTTVTYTGPVAQVRLKEAELLAAAPTLSGLASVEIEEMENGRASLVANYERASLGNNIPGIEDSIQELNYVEMVRDIITDAYFSTLTNAQIVSVRKAFERQLATDSFDFLGASASWIPLQFSLYGHLTHGQETAFYSYPELVQTWKTTSDKAIRKSCANPNTKRDLPQLNSTNQKLVADLPITYEWLKRPTKLSYLGRGYWSLTETWTGFPKISIIYGGTFTGIDP
jgi:hypothetical protein